jgi:CDGSH-type Zn-finger protein
MKIKGTKNGPMLVHGEFSITVGDQIQIFEGTVPCALCRCGLSRNKPFCDGSHAPRYDYGGWEDGVEFEVE